MKWNESGFRPLLCTYRLNWARRTSWGWWDDWDDTVLQTQDSKFEPWRSEAEHATSRSRRLPTILTFTRGWGRNIFVSLKPPRPGTEPRTLAWKAAVLTTTLGPPPPMLFQCWLTSAVQYLPTLQVSRYCSMTLQGRPAELVIGGGGGGTWLVIHQLPAYRFKSIKNGRSIAWQSAPDTLQTEDVEPMLFFVGPPSSTLAQHYTNIGSASGDWCGCINKLVEK